MSTTEEAPLWKASIVLALLILAYCGKYFCTSCLYVVQTLWQDEENISNAEASYMLVLGYVASMIGKAVAGPLADTLGGKKVNLVSAGGFILLITLFAYVGPLCRWLGIPQYGGNYYPEYLFVWFLQGFFALGLSWVAIMAVASNWIPAAYNGRMMAILGTAPELGDAWARAYLSPVISATGSWSETCLSAARASFLLVIPMIVFVRDSPGEPTKKENKAKKEEKSFGQRLKKLFTESPLIILLITMCAFLYGIRTMFLLYSVNYLSIVFCAEDFTHGTFHQCEINRLTVGRVAQASMLYTVFGVVGVLLSGVLKDKFPKRQRGSILVGNTLLLTVTLVVMFAYDMTKIPFTLATVLVGFVGFSVFGAYKTSTGAFAVDIGGKHLKATCSALMGFSSNGAAAAMIIVKGHVGTDWSVMFSILVVLSICSVLCALGIWMHDLKTIKPHGDVRGVDKTPLTQVRTGNV